MESTNLITPACLELLKVGITFLAAIISLITAYFVYRLGLKAFFRQKEYENVRKRYLESGVELVSSQIDYALGVYRHNWMLLLRIMKQYRDIEEQLSVDDFFEQFIELDQSYFQITPMYRVHVLFKSSVVWEAYQKAFSFVGTTNDKIKAEFGSVLKAMLEVQKHPNKDDFLKKAHQLAIDIDQKSQKFSILLAELQGVAELLERENLTRQAISVFASRQEVKRAVQILREVFPGEEKAQP